MVTPLRDVAALRHLCASALLSPAMLLLTLTGSGPLTPRPDETAEAVRDEFIDVNGVQLHYRTWGSAEAPPLLILHGLTGHAWEFDGIASALADEYHVFVLNQRGHGASDWADEYSPALMADDIAAFVEALQLDAVRVIGHSMGGANSWRFAAEHPDRTERFVNVDIDPTVITSDDVVTAFVGYLDFFAQARYTDPEEAVQDYLADYEGAHEDELRTFVLNNLVLNADGRWAWRFDAAGLTGWFDQARADEAAHWRTIAQIACPTLLVSAADSPFTTPAAQERMAAAMPDARLIEIAGSGHDVHIDQPEAFVAQLKMFLAAAKE